MFTAKNATIANMIATNQAVGDRMPIFRDSVSGNWFGILQAADLTEEVVPINGNTSEGSMGGATATPNTYVGVAPATLVLPAAGTVLNLVINNTNTGAATLNIEATGALAIQKPNGVALVAGDLVSGDVITVIMGAAQAFYVFAGVNQGDGTVLGRTIITSAQILALFTTPQPLVPNITNSVGTNSIEVMSCFVFNNHGGTDYAMNAAGFTVQYITSNNTCGITFTQAFGQVAADALATGSKGETMVTPVAGEGIELLAGTANPTLGDGVLEVDTHFRIHNFV